MPPDPKHDPPVIGPAAGRRFACHAARLLDDGKCEDVTVLDLRGLSPVADYMVIATGTSDRQLHAMVRELAELAEAEGQPAPLYDGQDSKGWVVADLFDVVVHLFSHEVRGYYDLESLWADALDVDWRAVTRPGQFAKVGAHRKA